MQIKESEDDRQFRDQVRDWLESNVPREPRPNGGPDQRAFDVAWRKCQFEGGWSHISWPEKYGGLGLSTARQLIWHEEYARAGAPTSLDSFFVALNHAGPTLIARGDESQKSYHLPRILEGEDIWCQGFSEPGAGSDLAGLRTRGVIDGDDLVVTGQKIWTTNGNVARFQELLVRTDPGAPKHKGISWVIAEMGVPGMDIRPIRNIVGEEHFCEVFYDEVRIPLTRVVGGLNQGWSVAMSTLAFERGVASVPHIIHLEELIEELIDLARSHRGENGRPAIADDAIGSQFSQLRSEAVALKSFAYLSIARAERASGSGAEGSIVRLAMAELGQRAYRLAMEILGPDALILSGFGGWTYEYLSNLRHTIAGGTSEIQRNIIGERMLGLPKGS